MLNSTEEEKLLESTEVTTVEYVSTVSASVVDRNFSAKLTATTELLFFAPPGGVVDYFVESIFFTNPIVTRLNGNISPASRDVTKRDGSIVSVRNILESEQF